MILKTDELGQAGVLHGEVILKENDLQTSVLHGVDLKGKLTHRLVPSCFGGGVWGGGGVV